MNRQRWLLAVLIFSLGVNAALITMMLRPPRPATPSADHPPRYAFESPFPTNPEQRQKIETILKKFRLDTLAIKEEIFVQRVEILEQLGSPEPDPAKVKEYLEAMNRFEAQLNGRFIDALSEITDLLDSGQRMELLSRMSRNWYFLTRFPDKGGQHE